MTGILARSIQTPALVYVRGLRGHAVPQIWWHPVPDLDGYWRGRILAAHPLGADAGVPMATLQRLYPAPAMPVCD